MTEESALAPRLSRTVSCKNVSYWEPRTCYFGDWNCRAIRLCDRCGSVNLINMSEAPKELPNIFEYDDFRKFVTDAFQTMKVLDKKFSLRYFARVAGFSSHNFLRHVMYGTTNLSPESIDKIAKGFKFNQEQTQFFRNLVYINQATTNEEKQKYAKELLKSRTYKKIHPLNESKYQFFARWYVSALRELVALPGFKEDPAWIADHMIPKIKVREAERAIQDLLRLGLLKRDEAGKLAQADALISTPNEVSSAYVANWHKQYLKKAAESIDNIPREKRDITALSFGISSDDLKKVKELANNFRREVSQMANQNQKKNMLYQLNIQLFPLGETDEGGDL